MAQFSKNTDDLVLWHLFREGDEAAYSTLAQRYYARLIHYGQKFTPNRQLIEDALQDLLVHLWVYRENLNATQSVKFYLLKAFRHQLFKAIRKNPLIPELDEHADEHPVEFSIEEAYIQRESDSGFTSKVAEQLLQLPVRQREVIYLRFFQGLAIDEIADLLEIRSQSVSNLIQRALANLRENWPIALLLVLLCTALSGR